MEFSAVQAKKGCRVWGWREEYGDGKDGKRRQFDDGEESEEENVEDSWGQIGYWRQEQ